MNVLLVDDEPNTRDVYAGLITHAGHRVVTADSAASAAGVIDGGLIDVAFIDLVLGGPDGFAVLEYLRRHQPSARAVIVTAYDVSDTARRSRALGVEAVLSKPVKWEELEHFLRPVGAEAGETR